MGRRVGKLLAFAVLGLGGLLLSSCASTSDTKQDEQVSTIPWDRPEKWESGNGFPGMNSNPGGY